MKTKTFVSGRKGSKFKVKTPEESLSSKSNTSLRSKLEKMCARPSYSLMIHLVSSMKYFRIFRK